MSDNDDQEKVSLLGGLLEAVRAAANAEDGTATRRESREMSVGRVSIEHSVRIGLCSDVSVRHKPASEREDDPRPVRVETDGTDRLVTVDVADAVETSEALSAVVSGDALRINSGDEILHSVALGDGTWRVADATCNNGVYRVRVVQ